jgi:hypothetical protein
MKCWHAYDSYLSLHEQQHTLWGSTYVTSKPCPILLWGAPKSFYQVALDPAFREIDPDVHLENMKGIMSKSVDLQ